MNVVYTNTTGIKRANKNLQVEFTELLKPKYFPRKS